VELGLLGIEPEGLLVAREGGLILLRAEELVALLDLLLRLDLVAAGREDGAEEKEGDRGRAPAETNVLGASPC
jgi:hypothetical protein